MIFHIAPQSKGEARDERADLGRLMSERAQAVVDDLVEKGASEGRIRAELLTDEAIRAMQERFVFLRMLHP